jgi:histidinol-phosphate aminotransferase
MTAAPPNRAAPVDLSMNETPQPPLPSVLAALRDTVATANRYPDHAAGDLVAALAARLAVPPAQVLVGPGSAGLAQLLVQSLAAPGRDEVVHPDPSFEGYPLVIGNAGARPVPVPLAGYAHDLPALAAACTERTRCVLLCSPNNPTGAVLRHRDVVEFLDRLPGHVTVIIDEAYHEFVTEPAAVDALALHRERDSVCVLRTFSKAYGLAGLRVGYAAVPAALAGPARRTGFLFYPGGPAQQAALAALGPAAQEELRTRRLDLLAARGSLTEDLRGLGLPVAPSQANFLWLPLGPAADRFTRCCAAAGIRVRAFPGLGVRITVGTPAAHARLTAVAADFAGVGW